MITTKTVMSGNCPIQFLFVVLLVVATLFVTAVSIMTSKKRKNFDKQEQKVKRIEKKIEQMCLRRDDMVMTPVDQIALSPSRSPERT